jgi:hypothetical protein
MKRHASIAILICVTVSILSFGFIKAISRSPQQGTTAAVAAADARSLRQKAKVNGHVTATANPRNLHRYEELASLKRDSASVVIGTVSSQASTLLPPNENIIVTDYQVTVVDVLKSDVKPGQTISVRAPGGRVQFEDGSLAEVNLPDYWKNPEVGKTYVMFLESRPGGTFVLTGGPQGLFEITANGGIAPQVRAEDKLMQAYKGRSKAAFIAEASRESSQK